MDIGDIIFLLIMGIGFLSSLGSASKKKRRSNRPPPPQRTDVATRGPKAGPATRPAKKSRLQEARDRAMSQMEELLRELEGGPKKPETPTQPPETDGLSVESHDLVLVPSVPPERPMPPSVPAPRDGSLHKLFHDNYIRPLDELKPRSTTARVRSHLSPKSLREAVLIKEILGPPKGLQ